VIFGVVRSVDFVVDVVIGVVERDVPLDAARSDPTFVPRPSASEPGGGGPVDGSDVEVLTSADDPDRHRVAERVVIA
jgi:hypothetical protein